MEYSLSLLLVINCFNFLSDPTLTDEEKLKIINVDITHLNEEVLTLNKQLACKRNQKYLHKRALNNLISRPTPMPSESEAFQSLRNHLPNSIYEFFTCQRLHRKFPPWNFASLEIPTIANRCGLGARETLYKIFRMPTLRTICRYRKILKKDPNSVPDDHLLKNDLQKKFHRKLFRRNRTSTSGGPKSMSSVLNDYIVRVKPDGEYAAPSAGDSSSELQLDCVESNSRQPRICLMPDLDVTGSSNGSYQHKKYNNSPQKWKWEVFEETEIIESIDRS